MLEEKNSPVVSLQSIAGSVAYHLHTAFLFTKSDIKTTLIPITFFAAAAAPITDFGRLPHVIFWIWVHLLQFDVSNQTINPEEDELNKRDRPLPSKRMTLEQALWLRYSLVPVCFILSLAYSVEVLCVSIALVFLTFLYDELGAHAGHWIVRNAVNAAGFAAFESGATLIAGKDAHYLSNVGVLSICFSAGIFATTIQAQDFKDKEGDRTIGRKTIPIVFPDIGRYTVIVPMLAWSVGLSIVWGLDILTAVLFTCLALWVGGRFLALRSIHADQVTFYWYNVWLSAAHALPGYYHLFVKTQL
ncbi:hypothetical protein CPC08DRAFT_646965 [Agrocybe pediades]|nr:hypothetical protein CPC08DRAFT_646965 [Agrocybe pediades]